MLGTLAGVALLAACAAVAIGLGRHRWSRRTQHLRSALAAGRGPVMPAQVDLRELEGLPSPVQRYLRLVLSDGAPMVSQVQVRHSGSMNLSAKAPQWKAFTSDQQIVTRRPGFLWNARVELLPGVPVLVHDAYIGGAGTLRAALCGLVTVANQHGGAELAKGELMRFLAEAVWYPTALLPSQGVRWDTVDAQCARATLSDAGVTVSLDFFFDHEGLVDSVRAHARGRTTGGRSVPTPWHGRFWRYQERGGMLLPLSGEVAWELPAGAQPYWRGDIDAIVHGFTA